MAQAQRSVFVPFLAIIIALAGLALCAGGVWLISLGGSWYYLIGGLGFLVTA
jgi:quinoprotein glucose dehydrogenase